MANKAYEPVFLGWAFYEDMKTENTHGKVVFFSSDYKTKKAVLNNVDRCVSAFMGGDYVSNEVHIYGLNDNTLAREEAEFFARNHQCDVQFGALAVSKDVKTARNSPTKEKPRDDEEARERSIVDGVAKEYGAMRETIQQLFDAFMCKNEQFKTYEDAERDFHAFYDLLVGGVAVA